MAVKEIDHILVQFEGARRSEEHWATEEVAIRFQREDDGTLLIYEEDADEKRLLVAYAPRQWSAVRFAWKGTD